MLYSLYVTLYCVHSFTTEQDEENQTRSNNQAVLNMVAGPWWSTSSDQLKQPACTKKIEKKKKLFITDLNHKNMICWYK